MTGSRPQLRLIFFLLTDIEPWNYITWRTADRKRAKYSVSVFESMDPSYPAVPLFNFLGFILVLIPLPWQLQSWNTGTCMFSIWVSLACLDCFIRTVVWRDNVNNYAPIYCDICSSFKPPMSVFLLLTSVSCRCFQQVASLLRFLLPSQLALCV